MLRTPLAAVLACIALGATGCHGPIYEKPPAFVGGRPIRTGAAARVVENGNLLMPGESAYRNYDRYLAAPPEAGYLIVCRNLDGPEPNVQISPDVPGLSTIFAGGSGSGSVVYPHSHAPSDDLHFPEQGRVLATDPSTDTVLISIGQVQPVEVGDHLTVLRNGRYRRTVRILALRPSYLVGLLLDGPAAENVQIGDAVSIYNRQGS